MWRYIMGYVRKQYTMSVQDQFWSKCKSGYESGDFSGARSFLAKPNDIDIPAVVHFAIKGDDSVFLADLFAYYRKNVLDKLGSASERQTVREILREKTQNALLEIDEEKQDPEVVAEINKEFPGDDRQVSDFETDSDDTANLTSEDEGVPPVGDGGLSHNEWATLINAEA